MSGAPTERRPVRAIIVDDEPAGRDVVRTLLAEVDEVEVVGEAANGRDAVAVVRERSPDLLFLDIQMPDIDGFSVIDELGDAVPPGVVLVTAHGEHAPRAFDVHAIDYVVKPFGRPRFRAAIHRALHRLEADRALGMQETLRSLVRSLEVDRAGHPPAAALPFGAGPDRDRIGVRIGTRTVLIEVEDIDWIEADGDLARVHVADDVHLLSNRMQELEAMLPPTRFLRVHRSSIVNLRRVRELHRDSDGGGAVVLESAVRLRVSRGRWKELERALGLQSKG